MLQARKRASALLIFWECCPASALPAELRAPSEARRCSGPDVPGSCEAVVQHDTEQRAQGEELTYSPVVVAGEEHGKSGLQGGGECERGDCSDLAGPRRRCRLSERPR